jgi:hypothetical protein
VSPVVTAAAASHSINSNSTRVLVAALTARVSMRHKTAKDRASKLECNKWGLVVAEPDGFVLTAEEIADVTSVFRLVFGWSCARILVLG